MYHFNTFIVSLCVDKEIITILSNGIFSIRGKYYNTIIAEIFGNVRHILVVRFKRYIKTYFLNRYSYLCHVDNCYISQD